MHSCECSATACGGRSHYRRLKIRTAYRRASCGLCRARTCEIQLRSIEDFSSCCRHTGSTEEIEMVARENKDSHRYSYSGGVKAVEQEKWGRDTAIRRYGTPAQTGDMNNPRDRSAPQFKDTDGRGADWRDDVSEKSWIRGGGEDGRPKNFDPYKARR